MKRILIVFLFASTLAAQNYTYKESFETSNPFTYWTSNATYTINYFGVSTDRAVDGSKSLKMDITINGSGTNDCYYYWRLPVNVNLHGTLDFSASLYMDSETATYVKLGYYYGFPPTAITRTPVPSAVTQYNTWFNQTKTLSDDVLYHADYFSDHNIYNSTRDDFGRELKYLHLMIKGKGSHHLVFYIDNIQITGSIIEPSQYAAYINSVWSNYTSRIDIEVNSKRTAYNNLTPVPDITGQNLSALALSYYNKLVQSRTNMSNLLTTMDNSEYFAPAIMDSMNSLLGLYPGWIAMLQSEMYNPGSAIDIYTFPSTIYSRLDETNQPLGLSTFEKLSLKACPEEYEPLSILLEAKTNVNNVTINWTNFTNGSDIIPASALDVYIAKVWYQAGITETEINNKILTQELLIKSDSLVKVDFVNQKNYLLVTNSSGIKQYIDISNPTAVFPSGVTIKDRAQLQPFSILNGKNKQIWFKFHIPDVPAGIYRGQISVYTSGNLVRSFPVEIEVLPFKLDPSRLTYGLYYNGILDNVTDRPFYFTNKKETQLRLELEDMRNHGVLYPTTYQSLSKIDGDLSIRNEVGLPTDRLYSLGLKTGNPQSQAELDALKTQVQQWKNKASQYGYKNLYFYGIDEATGETLTSERAAWNAVHQMQANVFVSGYEGMSDIMGDILDLAIVLGDLRSIEAAKYHSKGHKIFSYSNPQCGYENPEIYRRNYGLTLWKNGYDGAMNYAYQKNYGAMWNDFDGTKYRDQCFTYAATDQVISTVQWEGFSEGIDDVRYISTLLNKIDLLKNLGQDASSYENFINSIDPEQDLDIVRDQIIEKIKQITVLLSPENSAPIVNSVEVIDNHIIKVDFSKCISGSESQDPANYTISDGVAVYSALLNTDAKSVMLYTTPVNTNDVYNLEVNNVRDISGNLICSINNKGYYTLSQTLKLRLKLFLQGSYQNGVISSSLASKNLIPAAQPFNKTPWNYNGSEQASGIPSNTVDWILVELRNPSNPSQVLASKAAFLINDGYTKDFDSEYYINFAIASAGDYYIAVRHRNHLPVMSASPVNLSILGTEYDFTTGTDKVTNSNSIVQLSPGIFGLRAGDGDSNGVVNILDYNQVASKIFQSGYFACDLDLNGTVTVLDYQKTLNSIFKTSTLP